MSEQAIVGPSTRKIYKYKIPRDREFAVKLPIGATVLPTLHMQWNGPAMWAIVNPMHPDEVRTFRVIETGQAFEEDRLRYVGTFFFPGVRGGVGQYVGHLFEVLA